MRLAKSEITQAFVEPHWSKRFPPILTVDQAAELLQVPVATIYTWRSRRALGGSCRKVGKHLRFFRDRLVSHVFNEGVVEDDLSQ